MRNLLLSLVTFAAAVSAVIYAETPARACGACFVPPSEETAVDSHRMVIALGLQDTILWDQIIYSGDPADFVWVLPVPTPDVEIQVADDEFFNELDAQSAPRIQPVSSPPFCALPQSSGCLTTADPDFLGEGPPTPDGVVIYDHDVVGPYATLTIGAEDPNALYDWLEGNGYNITEDAVPAMEHYIGLGHAFVVLRLQPDATVDAMQPVRIRYPGFMGTFPLKMVVVGAQGALDLSLWVIAEQRYEASNYGTLLIDEQELVWDWAESRSNYREVFDELVAGPQGLSRAWVAEYAGPLFDLPVAQSDALEEIWDIIQVAPYVTRLRTRILVENIDEDMILAPSEDPGDISNDLLAFRDINYPELECPSADGDDNSVYCRLGNGSGRDAAFLFGVIVCGLLLVFQGQRRRRRRRRLRA